MRAHATLQCLTTQQPMNSEKRLPRVDHRSLLTRIPEVSDRVGFVELALLYQTLYADFHFNSKRLRYECRLLPPNGKGGSTVRCIHSLCFHDHLLWEGLQSIRIREYYITLAQIYHPDVSNPDQLVVSH
jgi:hypothetical protein